MCARSGQGDERRAAYLSTSLQSGLLIGTLRTGIIRSPGLVSYLFEPVSTAEADAPTIDRA